MNEKLKYLNKEGLSLSISTKTITGFAAQQPLEFDSPISAAQTAVFVAIKIAALAKNLKIVFVEDAAKILKLFISPKFKRFFYAQKF
jgi:hypothetical protein